VAFGASVGTVHEMVRAISFQTPFCGPTVPPSGTRTPAPSTGSVDVGRVSTTVVS